jgi:hypothetical protein
VDAFRIGVASSLDASSAAIETSRAGEFFWLFNNVLMKSTFVMSIKSSLVVSSRGDAPGCRTSWCAWKFSSSIAVESSRLVVGDYNNGLVRHFQHFQPADCPRKRNLFADDDYADGKQSWLLFSL